MHSIQLLRSPTRCGLCRTEQIPAGLAGFQYRLPLCRQCFKRQAPAEFHQVLEDLGKRPASIRVSPAAASCSQCGTELLRFAGSHRGSNLCSRCLQHHAPVLSALLVLEAAIWKFVTNSHRGAPLALLAAHYVGVLSPDPPETEDAPRSRRRRRKRKPVS